MSRTGSYKLASLALYVHGITTALLLELLLGRTYVTDLFRGMNLKLPALTKMLLHVQPLFVVPGTWVALSVLWVGYLSRRAQRPSLSDRSLSLPADDSSTVETFLVSHVVLCCLLMVVGMGCILPFYQLIGCLC